MKNIQTDISDLAHHLMQEKLFIDYEKEHIICLNEKVMKMIEKVYHASFVRGEQHRNYNNLILRPHSLPPSCCQKANLLSQLQFIDGYQVLGHNESLFGEMLLTLRENPRLIAQCLVDGESSNLEAMQVVASAIFSSIYANCILPDDELHVLHLLKHLMELQLSPSENPRRLLHHGSCAFSQVYRAYIDTLPQAKVFLTAALHQPIMQLLMEDELFLDIDPAKAAERFSQEERHKRFGEETKDYDEALAKYRSWTINKLVKITNRFIESIKQAMHCLPATLSWLVRTLYEVLLQSKKLDVKEVSTICIDLVFTFFLCSAVVTPEPQGIVDAPISHIARFNLIQVAQILQVLAMNCWEAPDSRQMDLYSHFDKEVMSGLIENIIEQRGSETPPVSSSGTCPLIGLTRSSCIIPETHLLALINFLMKTSDNNSEDLIASRRELEAQLGRLTPHLHILQASTLSLANNSHKNFNGSPHGNGTSTGGSPSTGSSSSTGSPKKNLLNRVKSSSRRSVKLSSNHDVSVELDNESSASHMNSPSQNINDISNLSSQHSVSADEKDDSVLSSASSQEYENVLVIGFPCNTGRPECPGMMQEDRVLLAVQQASKSSASRVQMNLDEEDRVNGSGVEGIIEKRTRFSLSHDDGSIGNTSDNLEAISEAASNHSVASSMDDDDVEQVDPPDNLSDMVSANVSGRGTPNVSGRDTPSSQITDGDDVAVRAGTDAVNRPSNISVNVPKSARADIEEKFGRFEIKPILGGDETVSLVSDTWSTDVLASDSETIEAADRVNRGDERHEQFLDQHLEELDRMHGGGPGEFMRGESAGETFETASEAWSTDVLASDSERLTEFDTDDAQSVARSDDTGRSEVETEMVGSEVHILRPEQFQEENATPRANASRSPVEADILRRCSDGNHLLCEEIIDKVGNLDLASESSSKKVKYMPVMQISENDKLFNASLGFKPINDVCNQSEHLSNGIAEEDFSQRGDFMLTSGTQSSGNLTLTLSDLPSNGIIPVSRSLLLNHFAKVESSTCSDNVDAQDNIGHLLQPVRVVETSKRATIVSFSDISQQKILSSGGSAEDGSIHLSTASLVSSSSSGSEASKDQPQSSVAMVGVENSIALSCEPIEQLPPSGATSTPISSMASTGAIPKSISFDKTAEKGDREAMDNDSKHKKGFFKGFKLPVFKGRRKVVGNLSNRSEDFPSSRSSLGPDVGIRRSLSEDSRRPILEESTDDILAKYRKKPEILVPGSNGQTSDSPNSTLQTAPSKVEDERLFIDITNIESSYAFKDAKRKLRIVLSSADFCMSSNYIDFSTLSSCIANGDDLLTWLKTQLAEAQNLHDRPLVAQLHEALRCILLFDQQGRESLVDSLREDYQSRAPYIAYLVRSRQGLLNSIAHLEKLLSRLNEDTNVIITAMVSVCVRLFIEKRDNILTSFTKSFTQLTAPDEKVELVESFLSKLFDEIERDPMWMNSTSDQLTLAQTGLERAIMSHIYIHALYPNGDGDVNRDQVLYEHMKKLSTIITPDHKDLCIPKLYQYECPWPSAQSELVCLGAYKTSADKVRCVVRASRTIMNLLSMAQETSVAAADDFIPVLVYVLIKANPPGLLSTVQYVNLFYERRLEGEDQYWWTQFCSTIEFIKTMDYAP